MGSATPPPIGPGVSFSNVPLNTNTTFFEMGKGYAVMTFQPVDVNNPGVATLYAKGGTVLLTMDREGYANWYVPIDNSTYYFAATLGAKFLALTQPTIGFR
jgi:hypothetical protein